MATSRCVDGWNESYRAAERRAEATRSMCRSYEAKIERLLAGKVIAFVWLEDATLNKSADFFVLLINPESGRRVEFELGDVLRALAAGPARFLSRLDGLYRPAQVLTLTDPAFVLDDPDSSQAATALVESEYNAAAYRAAAVTQKLKKVALKVKEEITKVALCLV